VQSSPDDLTLSLTRNRGWYSIGLDFGGTPPRVQLIALVNPAMPFSTIKPEAIDQLMRWEFVPLTQQRELLLSGLTVQGQTTPDLVVRVSSQRTTAWDIVIGANFFSNFTDLHLNLDTSVVRLSRR
jgi:hypothetical protein